MVSVFEWPPPVSSSAQFFLPFPEPSNTIIDTDGVCSATKQNTQQTDADIFGARSTNVHGYRWSKGYE